MAHIPNETLAEMKSLCMQGEKLAKIGDHPRAVEKFNEALTLVPRPRKSYPEATFIYAAIGESQYCMKNYEDACKSFFEAFSSEGGDKSAQICLRLGQCIEECGDRRRAHEYLKRALDMADEGLFADVDIKYYKTATAKPYQLQREAARQDSRPNEAASAPTAASDEKPKERESFVKKLFARFKEL
ncbi:MAG: hypothetical protein J6L81_04235 [Clostridia bacterium]|nr:hypothetical protein [Clostridia bacterium]